MGRRRRRGGPHGILWVDKPTGPTSHRVVRDVEHRLGAARAGHAGTLDPMASGLLVVLLGEATKLSPWIVGHDKVYRATIRLGIETDTLDADGVAVASAPVPELDGDRVRTALSLLEQQREQVPPVISAIKVEGRSLMRRARAGERVEPGPRPVVCHALRWLGARGADLHLEVHCAKGYYVRALARDLGQALGTRAHLAALRRLRSGPFGVDQATAPERVTVDDVRPMAAGVPEVPLVVLDSGEAAAVANGRRVPAREPGVRALLAAPDGTPLAMAERAEGELWRVVRGFQMTAP